MPISTQKWGIGILIILILIGIGGFYFFKTSQKIPELNETKHLTFKHEIIGESVENREIEAYTYGTGQKHLIFVGGIHGGYEWNSIILAYKFIDYLKNQFDSDLKNLKITVIPSLNPDGVYKIIHKNGRFEAIDIPKNEPTESGRFNANQVDLNRNFDCKWKNQAVWRGKQVSAGIKPFSEPEAEAFKNFVLKNNPTAVIFWHSQANTIYASECENGILPETLKIMELYSNASGYHKSKSFDSYEVTGDAGDWLASINIPAIAVELETHQFIDWEKNLAGIKSLFKYYNSE